MAGKKLAPEIDAQEELLEQELQDGDDVGTGMPERETVEANVHTDEYNALQAERDELLKKLAALDAQENLISDQYGLLATVPDIVVDVTLNYPPEPHPNDSSGTIKFQPKVVIQMKEGDLLNMFPPRGSMESMPIPRKKMEAMADYYAKRGIVFWDGTKLPEQGGETKEEAITRGIKAFLEMQGTMEYHLLVQKTDIGINRGHNAVPNDDVLRVTEPTTLRMRQIAEKCKRKMQLEGLQV